MKLKSIFLFLILGVFSLIGISVSAADSVVSNIRISGTSNSWEVGSIRTVLWNISDKSDPTGSIVYICNPTNVNLCKNWNSLAELAGGGSVGPIYNGSEIIGASVEKKVGQYLIARLNGLMEDPEGLTRFFNNYQTKIKVCPATGPCAFGPIITVIPQSAPSLTLSATIPTSVKVGDSLNIVYQGRSLIGYSCSLTGSWGKSVTVSADGLITGNETIKFTSAGAKTFGAYCSKGGSRVDATPVTLTVVAVTPPRVIPANPKITGAFVDNVSEVTESVNWRAGDTKSIKINYEGFNQAVSQNINLVRVELCKSYVVPSTATCLTWGTSTVSNEFGSLNLSRALGANLYNRLNNGDVSVLKYFSDNDFSAFARVCPVIVGNVVPNGATCVSSNPFKVISSGTNVGPTISNIKIGGATGLVDWKSGAYKDINFNYSAFGKIKHVQISLCHPNTDKCGILKDGVLVKSGDVPYEGGKSVNQSIGPNVYDRLSRSDAELTPYYDANKQAVIKVCPVSLDSQSRSTVVGTCATGMFKVTDPNVIPDSSPSITNVRIDGEASTEDGLNVVLEWSAGSTKTISWDYSNFGRDSARNASLLICSPIDPNKCDYMYTLTDKMVPFGGNSSSGSVEVDRPTGVKAYENLAKTDGNNTFFKDYQTRIRICPWNRNLNPVYVRTNIGRCADGPMIKITPFDPDAVGGGSSYFDNIPSGQGCIQGECVCVNGVRMRCGNPMTSGASCGNVPTVCNVTTASLSSRLTASLSQLGDWFMSIFK